MLKSRKIAVTGGLACGKSSVCQFLEEFGAEVVDADKIVHHLIATDAHLQEQLIQLLDLTTPISREQIAEKVFGNPNLLKSLEQLLHPAVHREIEKRYQQSKAPLFVAEVPLLFESEMHRDYDAVIAVTSDERVSRKRFKGSAFDERLARQLPLQEKAAAADFVLENNSSLEELKQKTHKLYQHLKDAT